MNATIFSLASSALLRPLPGVASPHRLVWLSTTWRGQARQAGLSYPDYADYRDGSGDVFTEMLAFYTSPISLGSGGTPQRLRGQAVSGSFFSTLGVTPDLGRLLGPADDVRGSTDRVAAISYGLWQRRFGGAVDVLQRPVLINGEEFRVVGVASSDFRGPSVRDAADIWVPLALWPDVRRSDRLALEHRASAWLSVMGRLRDGVTPARAQHTLAVVGDASRPRTRRPTRTAAL